MRLKPMIVVLSVISTLVLFPGAVIGSDEGMMAVNRSLYVLSSNDEIRANWTGDLSFGEGEMAIPQLFQADFTNILAVYKGEERSVKSSGCGAVCLSMALAYLRPDLAQSPETIFRDACLAGYYKGNGLSMATIRSLAQRYGIQAEYGGKYRSAIRAALSQGYPVIAYMDKGCFSGGGHYVLLRGITQDDQVRINDPNNPERSAQTYPLSLIVEQSRSGSPFLICKP